MRAPHISWELKRLSDPQAGIPEMAALLRTLAARQYRAINDPLADALMGAARRLEELHADLATAAPALTAAAERASRGSAEGRAFRAACDRLVAKVIA
jgi:hypothetical protein